MSVEDRESLKQQHQRYGLNSASSSISGGHLAFNKSLDSPVAENPAEELTSREYFTPLLPPSLPTTIPSTWQAMDKIVVTCGDPLTNSSSRESLSPHSISSASIQSNTYQDITTVNGPSYDRDIGIMEGETKHKEEEVMEEEVVEEEEKLMNEDNEPIEEEEVVEEEVMEEEVVEEEEKLMNEDNEPIEEEEVKEEVVEEEVMEVVEEEKLMNEDNVPIEEEEVKKEEVEEVVVEDRQKAIEEMVGKGQENRKIEEEADGELEEREEVKQEPEVVTIPAPQTTPQPAAAYSYIHEAVLDSSLANTPEAPLQDEPILPPYLDDSAYHNLVDKCSKESVSFSSSDDFDFENKIQGDTGKGEVELEEAPLPIVGRDFHVERGIGAGGNGAGNDHIAVSPHPVMDDRKEGGEGEAGGVVDKPSFTVIGNLFVFVCMDCVHECVHVHCACMYIIFFNV